MTTPAELIALIRQRPYVVRMAGPKSKWRSWIGAPVYQIVYDEDTVVSERVCCNVGEVRQFERFADSLNSAYSAGVADTLAKLS